MTCHVQRVTEMKVTCTSRSFIVISSHPFRWGLWSASGPRSLPAVCRQMVLRPRGQRLCPVLVRRLPGERKQLWEWSHLQEFLCLYVTDCVWRKGRVQSEHAPSASQRSRVDWWRKLYCLSSSGYCSHNSLDCWAAGEGDDWELFIVSQATFTMQVLLHNSDLLHMYQLLFGTTGHICSRINWVYTWCFAVFTHQMLCFTYWIFLWKIYYNLVTNITSVILSIVVSLHTDSFGISASNIVLVWAHSTETILLKSQLCRYSDLVTVTEIYSGSTFYPRNSPFCYCELPAWQEHCFFKEIFY